MLLSEGFLRTAKSRLTIEGHLTEPDLRRAVSDLYFAMLHTICETLAGTLGEPLSYTAAKEAWIRLYRLPDHAHVAKHCDDSRIREFPDEIQRFAAQFKAAKTCLLYTSPSPRDRG